MIRAIIFDWDGVFIDSSDIIWKGYNHLFSVGLTTRAFPSKEEFLDFFDTNWKNNCKPLGLDTEDKISAAITEYKRYMKNNPHPDDLVSGMKHLVDTLHGRAIKLGVASNIDNTDFILHAVLEKNEIDTKVESIVGFERVGVLKPDPAGLILCMKELDVSPEEVIFVGDSVNDIAAGKNAGVAATVAVAWGLCKKEKLLTANPDFMAESPLHLLELIDNECRKYNRDN